jgi:rhodanese-related sulfurtransferase
MSENGFPEPDVAVESTDPSALEERTDSGETVTVLGVRARSEFEEWHVADGEPFELGPDNCTSSQTALTGDD